MTDVRSLVWHLRDRHDRGRILETHAADAKLWYLALGELLRQGALDAAAHAAGPLRAAFPLSAMIARLAFLIETMPPPSSDRSFADFIDRRDAPVQVVRRGGSRTAVLAFCGRHGDFGMPLPIIHRWLDLLDAHVIYLRDLEGEIYLDGIPALASTRTGTTSALLKSCENLGASRFLCFGNSTGAYAALLYALEMEASAVLALNTFAALLPERIAAHLPASATSRQRVPPNLGRLYAAAAVRPRAHLVHSAGNGHDKAAAATLAGINDVTIEVVPGYDGHDVQVALIERRRFAPLLLDFARSWQQNFAAAHPS